MAKDADKYIKVDPWNIIEEGFNPGYSPVSESLFSLANEYMGVRGYFEEGYSGEKLIGSYFNGVYEKKKFEKHYKGVIDEQFFMVNGVDWLYTRLKLDGEELDLARSAISGFTRTLDMKKGLLTREFTWTTRSGKKLKITFSRFLSMVRSQLACQAVHFQALNFNGTLSVKTGLDFSPEHMAMKRNFWECPKKGSEHGIRAILGKTVNTGKMVFSGFRLNCPGAADIKEYDEKKGTGCSFKLDLKEGKESFFEKLIYNEAEHSETVLEADEIVEAVEAVEAVEKVWENGMSRAKQLLSASYKEIFLEHCRFWEKVWESLDISIEGDPENQQGIRYCIFQLHQTFHGETPGLNIGAKGLTGEFYNGNAFWDTEIYCLPFYIFNNPQAARSLLEFRYKTLPQAMERAKELDLEGAFYPVATINGKECCNLWQHASLQLQASTAVAYGIAHYVNILNDRDFLYTRGLEMLIQICRMLAARGQWNSKGDTFGYYSVMGPDEFQMMVNNNCYTNLMAKKTFEYTIHVIDGMKVENPSALSKVMELVGLNKDELPDWRHKGQNIKILFSPETGLYEQHEGYFDLPHIDVQSIPRDEFPLYHHWTYDRIYRNDMIKQPDVLMFFFLYNQDYSFEEKEVNYNYYESRCIHESSLSPSIHSILASEIGKHKEAFDFFKFATRMDIDNYNRNTGEGLHITSIAAAWMNIVYGFGGMRSDGDILTFNPSIPDKWNTFSFRVLYKETIVSLEIDKEKVLLKVKGEKKLTIKLYDKIYEVNADGVEVELQRTGYPAYKVSQVKKRKK